MQSHKVIIIGSGPAGHTAAIYCARANLDPIMYEGFLAGGVAAGGQLTTTTEVENFPGFPTSINGCELMDRFKEQSVKFGTCIVSETVSKVDLSVRPFKLWLQDKEHDPILAESVIIATGATAKRMFIKGEDIYWQNGISACAVCDGALPLFRKKELMVVGGGDSAAEEATFLTKFASKVYVVVRTDKLRASKVMADRLQSNPKIHILWNTIVLEAVGDSLLSGVRVQNTLTNDTKIIDVNGLFYAIGHVPNTQFLNGQLALDADGYIDVKPGSTHTSIEGVFAAGDVQDKKYRQAITAAGSGCMAALDAEHFIQSVKNLIIE
jgi:thioredoxin reductase (NADPH)